MKDYVFIKTMVYITESFIKTVSKLGTISNAKTLTKKQKKIKSFPHIALDFYFIFRRTEKPYNNF